MNMWYYADFRNCMVHPVEVHKETEQFVHIGDNNLRSAKTSSVDAYRESYVEAKRLIVDHWVREHNTVLERHGYVTERLNKAIALNEQ